MSFVDQYEDVNSLALTVVHNLLEKYRIDTNSIGRLEVGTETLLDKSKSTKTVLMQLFKNNTNIEGVATINACYGGTNALFNTINWIQSDAWDGRLGIVVCSDIAFYPKGPARATGGAGAVAMLIGPDAVFVIDPFRYSFMTHNYDFYKPDPRSQYPTVDGPLTITSYLTALDNCYKGFQQLYQKKNGQTFSVDTPDFFCFHAPFNKMVQKSFLRLVYLDGEDKKPWIKNYHKWPEKFGNQQAYNKLMEIAEDIWQERVLPSCYLSINLGNIYTGSLYSGLISLMMQKQELIGKQILMFSYGSGAAASMFSFRVEQSTLGMCLGVQERLLSRVKISPSIFHSILQKHEDQYSLLSEKDFKDVTVFNGTYYISKIDSKWRRTYQRQSQQHSLKQNQTSNDVEIEINRFLQLKDQFKNDSEKLQYLKLWSGFYKKTVHERLDLIQKIYPQIKIDHFQQGGLELENANLMVENCIGKLSIPLGLGLNFQLNGEIYTVPMAIEEPSVIAAASGAAKLVMEAGDGFHTITTRPIMMGQIQLVGIQDVEQVLCIIDKHKKDIILKGNEACPSMTKRGGGVEDVRLRVLSPTQASFDVFINVCDSMGANLVNTVCEHLGPYIEELTNVKTGIKILTNLCLERRSSARFALDPAKMSYKGVSGHEVCEKIIQAYNFAKLDKFRAVTHNKGIINGIEAVALATGQDFRAISSSLHGYASLDGYKPLTEYSMQDNLFVGKITIPISVGTQGGAIQSNPLYVQSLRILNYPDSQKLAEIMTCVGLASNLAALRALAVEGVQRGHMNLHARNLAIASGVPKELIEECVNFMKNRGVYRKETAEEFMKAYNIFRSVREATPPITQKRVLSTFSSNFKFAGLNEALSLHIVFDCCSKEPIHVTFDSDMKGQNKKLMHQIFGEKSYDWFQKLFAVIQKIRLDYELQGAQIPSKTLTYKLKIIAILVDLICFNMVSLNYDQSKCIYEELIEEYNSESIRNVNEIIVIEDIGIKYGLHLMVELARIFKYNLDQQRLNENLKGLLKGELLQIIDCHLRSYQLWNDAKQGKFDYEDAIKMRKKRLSCTMMLLCDCINLVNSQLTVQILETIVQLGDIYEIQITLARDSSKWMSSQIVSDRNIYTYWLLMKNKLLEGEKQSSLNEFMRENLEMLGNKWKELEPKLTNELRHLSQETTKVVNEYYQTTIPKPNL